MKIWMIWQHNAESADLWLVTAWDDNSKSGNEFGWLEALAKAETEAGGPRFIRVATTDIALDPIQQAFLPVNANIQKYAIATVKRGIES